MGNFLDKNGLTRFKEKMLTEVDKRIASGGGGSSSDDVPTKEEILEGAMRVTDVEVNPEVATLERLQTGLSKVESNLFELNANLLTKSTPYIVETWFDGGENWYRKWSDGFIEQGGWHGGYSGERNSVVSFHTPFTTIPNVQKTFITTSNAHGFLAKAVGLYSKPTTTSFEVNYVYGETDWFMWYACGY